MATLGTAPSAASVSAAVAVSMSMRRHVALVAPPWYPVPPFGYGGIETVVALLADELRARGHRVTLIAAEGSGPEVTTAAPAAWGAALGQREERLRELEWVEAMASGTPAISIARGAAPELIEEALTGFLVRDVDEMVVAVRAVREIEPGRCAAAARARFSPSVMVDGYLRIYAQSESTTANRRGWSGASTLPLLLSADRQFQPGRAPVHDVDAAAVALDSDVA